MNLRPSRVLPILFLLSLVLLLIFTPDAPSYAYYDNISRPLVIAHQGGEGLWPGDTMYAFENAVKIGADVLEMDAHITKDRQIVLMHDQAIDDTTDGTGFLEDFTLAELKQLDAAYKWSNDEGKTFPYRGQGIQVPPLEEVFQKFPQIRYVIEIKLTENPIDEPLCDLIRQYQMQDQVMIASFHDEAMQNFRETCTEVATSSSRTEVRNFVLLGKIFLSGFAGPRYQSIQPPYDPAQSMNIPIMTERFIREAHAKISKSSHGPWMTPN